MIRWMMLLTTLSLMAPLASPGASDGTERRSRGCGGTASYRERVSLPAGALFEATLADVARADAPAEPLGRVTLGGSSGPPFAFTIPYDAARIDPRGRYAVRARITLDGQLLFTSDTLYPVLGAGQPDRVEILMHQVGAPMACTCRPPSAASCPAPTVPVSAITSISGQTTSFTCAGSGWTASSCAATWGAGTSSPPAEP